MSSELARQRLDAGINQLKKISSRLKSKFDVNKPSDFVLISSDVSCRNLYCNIQNLLNKDNFLLKRYVQKIVQVPYTRS